MVKLKLLGATGRFGVRYGQATKKRIDAIEEKQRKKQKCIFCNGRAKRISKGIWSCKKCGKKFAGHAYFLEAFQEAIAEKFEKKPLKKEKPSVQDKEKQKEKTKKEKKPKAKK